MRDEIGGTGENGANKVGNGTRHKMEIEGPRTAGREEEKLLTRQDNRPRGRERREGGGVERRL